MQSTTFQVQAYKQLATFNKTNAHHQRWKFRIVPMKGLEDTVSFYATVADEDENFRNLTPGNETTINEFFELDKELIYLQDPLYVNIHVQLVPEVVIVMEPSDYLDARVEISSPELTIKSVGSLLTGDLTFMEFLKTCTFGLRGTILLAPNRGILQPPQEQPKYDPQVFERFVSLEEKTDEVVEPVQEPEVEITHPVVLDSEAKEGVQSVLVSPNTEGTRTVSRETHSDKFQRMISTVAAYAEKTNGQTLRVDPNSTQGVISEVADEDKKSQEAIFKEMEAAEAMFAKLNAEGKTMVDGKVVDIDADRKPMDPPPEF